MKSTKGRIRALTAMAKHGAYATLAGRVKGELNPIPDGVMGILLARGHVEQVESTTSPSYYRVITAKGLKWLQRNTEASPNSDTIAI